MLVLSRRTGESLRIGKDIEITLLDIKGDTVKIGINAPVAVKIWRAELFEAIASENLSASRITPDKIDYESLSKNLKKTGKGDDR